MRQNRTHQGGNPGGNRIDLWPFTEIILGLSLGVVLHLINLSALAQVSFLLGPALSGSRLLLTKKIEEQLEPVRRLSHVVDLESNLDDPELLELVRAYYEVVGDEFRISRSQIVHETTKRLRQFSREGRSDILTTGDYYRWLLPQLEKAQKGSSIWAVSMMMDCEWDDSPSEEKFLEQNMAAVSKGVKVDRVFVAKQSKISELMANKGVQAHLARTEPNLQAFVVFQEDLERSDPGLLRDIGAGFIAFDSHVVLVDVSSNDGMRGFYLTDLSRVQAYQRMFDSLKNLARPLRHPVLEGRASEKQPLTQRASTEQKGDLG